MERRLGSKGGWGPAKGGVGGARREEGDSGCGPRGWFRAGAGGRDHPGAYRSCGDSAEPKGMLGPSNVRGREQPTRLSDPLPGQSWGPAQGTPREDVRGELSVQDGSRADAHWLLGRAGCGFLPSVPSPSLLMILLASAPSDFSLARPWEAQRNSPGPWP